MPVLHLQGTTCRRIGDGLGWSRHVATDKAHFTAAAGQSRAGSITDKCQLSPYARLMDQLCSDERLAQERAAGTRVGLYRLYGDLGTGNFSRVKLAVHQLTADRVAVKIVDKAKLDYRTHAMLAEEIENMERLHHPHIVRLYEVLETPQRYHLVLEYAAGGNLHQLITAEGRLGDRRARALAVQLVSALQHMHDQNLVHRDVKADNVFLTRRGRAKLGDLGFSTRVTSATQQLTSFCGSPPYAAPELLEAASYTGPAVDMWALGVLLFFAGEESDADSPAAHLKTLPGRVKGCVIA
ncbi:serine/threonine-protein kinase NIM1-like [Pollicipes pollicipes]|uniref:serine/threonine-protein kinase NIM1-like n=1 Tax=Pollicipes pollicipes TaxID=41117 RepID=UPI00188499AD|nr:serine/threonine-protein kinase NIM1-like [Pollicipes pollicipes]